jgi:hypothetical protein
MSLAPSKSVAPRTHQPARAPMAVTSLRWAGSSSINNRQRLGSARILTSLVSGQAG